MTYNPAIPQANDLLSQSQADIETNFSQANTLFGINHITFNDATVADRGKHTTVVAKRLAFGAATPVTATDEGAIYTQEVAAAGRVEAYYKYPGGALAPIMQISGVKAWVKFAGATGVISAQYNVTSVTRNGAGDYTLNFTTNLTNADYVPVISAYCGLSGSGVGSIPGVNNQVLGSCRVFCRALTSNAGTDPAFVYVVILGN